MENDEELGELKGAIDYPCGCKARVLIYEESKGRFSVCCPICGKYALFDSGRMTAELTGPCGGRRDD